MMPPGVGVELAVELPVEFPEECELGELFPHPATNNVAPAVIAMAVIADLRSLILFHPP